MAFRHDAQQVVHFPLVPIRPGNEVGQRGNARVGRIDDLLERDQQVFVVQRKDVAHLVGSIEGGLVRSDRGHEPRPHGVEQEVRNLRHAFPRQRQKEPRGIWLRARRAARLESVP